MKKIFFCSLLALWILGVNSLAAHCLQDKLSSAHAGDYVVTAQEGNYSLLFIRSLTSDTLLLEEISIPAPLVSVKNFDWKKWAQEKAPGHTSWTLYEIERATGKLIECFSYSKNGWLYLEESGQFLTRLLTLPLQPVPPGERKKIGEDPGPGVSDTRALWTPALVREGKKVAKPQFDVLKTRWPDDGSRLSLCAIELYFSKDASFPFPYWLEVHSPHYTFKMRTVDSGKGLISPITGPMPHRPPHFLGPAERGEEVWRLKVQTPSYFSKLNLYAIDLFSREKKATPISFSAQAGSKKEELVLEISSGEVNKIFNPQGRYQWILIPESSPELRVESEPFTSK